MNSVKLAKIPETKLQHPFVQKLKGGFASPKLFFRFPLLVGGIIFLSSVATTRLWSQEKCGKSAEPTPVSVVQESAKVTPFIPKEINEADVENLKKAGIKNEYIRRCLAFQGITPKHFQTALDSTGIDFIKILNGEARQDSVK